MAAQLTGPVVSLFSGAMGLDLGLELAGVPTSLAVDIDPFCCETVRRNRPGIDVWEADVEKLDKAAIRDRLKTTKDIHFMVGGPPCQSFCPGGKRAALSDPRGNLIYAYLKLIQEVRPRLFLLENVANLVTAALRHRPIAERPGKHWTLRVYDRKKDGGGVAPMESDELSGSAIRQIIRDVHGLGYQVSLCVVDAADYGAPQHRLRFLMFGARESTAPRVVQPTHAGRKHGLRAYQTVRHGDNLYYTTNRKQKADPGMGIKEGDLRDDSRKI